MMAAAHNPIPPPSRLLLLAEGRALWEAGAAVAVWPLLQLTARGDGADQGGADQMVGAELAEAAAAGARIEAEGERRGAVQHPRLAQRRAVRS